MRLLNRTGQKMADLPVQPPADAAQPYQVDLPLAGLVAGRLRDRDHGEGVRARSAELIAIKVIS